MPLDWEDYLVAVCVAAGGAASLVQNDPKWFIILSALGLLGKAIKDAHDARQRRP